MKLTVPFRVTATAAFAALLFGLASCQHNDDIPDPVITSPVDSSTVAMDTAHWIYFGTTNYAYQAPRQGLFEFTSEGVKAYSQQSRNAAFLLTHYAYNLRNRSIRLSWKGNDGGAFSDYTISIADSTAIVWEPSTNTRNFADLNNLTTQSVYNGSVLINSNTWYYTSIQIDGAGAYTLKTATGNYAADGGNVVEQRSGTIPYTRGRISLRAGDPYAGPFNSFVIHELQVR